MNLDDRDDMEFWASMYFGSRKQKLTVNLDTGSSTLWFYSEERCDKSCPKTATFFKGEKSSSLEVAEYDWNHVTLRYGLGTWFGYKATDILCPTKDFCFSEPMQFVLVDSADEAAKYYNTGGLLGLAPTYYGMAGLPSFWE